MKPQVVVHGEVFVFPVTIPAQAKPLTINGAYLIVADSETTGNHHVIDKVPGVEFFEHEERRYMNSSVPTKIRCLHENRHDAIILDPGTYEFGTQQEYDPFLENMRNVRD